MKIFVTGASGFIGSHLFEKLVLKGHKVKALVPYNIDNSWGWIDTFNTKVKNKLVVVSGDITDQDLILKETRNCDIIFHLAALTQFHIHISPQEVICLQINWNIKYFRFKNTIMQKLLLHLQAKYMVLLKYIPIDENHPLNAQSPYAASKIVLTKLVYLILKVLSSSNSKGHLILLGRGKFDKERRYKLLYLKY